MEVRVTSPALDHVMSVGSGEGHGPFFVVRIKDRSHANGGGVVAMHVEGSWSDWDRLVAEVAAYRAALPAPSVGYDPHHTCIYCNGIGRHSATCRNPAVASIKRS